MEKFQLEQVIDKDVLQEIQDKFSNATGLSAVTVDFRGVPITEYSNFTPFCTELRKTEGFEERCHRCDAYGGLEAARKNATFIYRCHAGLADFAIPIKVQGQFIGSVLAGQAKLEDSDLNNLESIIRENTNYENNEKLVKLYEALPVTSLKKVEAGAKLLESIISNLIENDIIKYVQDRLSKKNEDLLEKVKNTESLEKDFQEKELTALQPRINMNFLNHSINAASRLSIIEDADKTTDILYLIADIIKYTVEQSNKLVKLEEEIVHVRRYLNLQMLRFGDRFQFELDIEEEVMNESIPSLLLQALVDNAIVHGLETKSGAGFLRIIASAVDDTVMIKVMDNGVGIPSDTLEKIQLDRFEKENNSLNRTTGIDLATMKGILNYHYGSDCNMTIKSHLQKGTSVMLSIPKESR